MAIKVPTYDRQVTGSSSIPDPQPVNSKPVEAAFGGQLAEAQAKLGETVSKVGDQLSKHLIAKQEQDDHLDVLKQETAARQIMQNALYSTDKDPNGKPVGLMARELDYAKGVTPEFDQQYQKLRQASLDSVHGENQKEQLAHLLDAHYVETRNSVIRHEASQNEASATKTLDSNLKQKISDAAGISDKDGLSKAIDLAQGTQTEGDIRRGASREVVLFNRQLLAGEVAKSSIATVLEKDPTAAQDLFDSVKSKIGAGSAAEITKMIDGKLIHDQQANTWDEVKNYKLADGTFDLAKAQGKIDQLDLPPEKKMMVQSYVHQMGSVANAEMHQQRQATERSFLDNAITQQKKGIPFQEALKSVAQYAYDPKDAEDKQRWLTDLYTGKADAMDRMLKHQTVEQSLMWKQIEEQAAAKFGNNISEVPGMEGKVKTKDAFLNEMKRSALGKSPEEMKAIADKKLKEIVVTPGWIWDHKEPNWKLDAGARSQNTDKINLLNKTYGESQVSQAKAFLQHNGRTDSPENIKEALDKVLAKRGQAAGVPGVTGPAGSGSK